MNTEERLKREKDFHNETFSSDSRKPLKKYYESASISKEFYREQIGLNAKGKSILEYGCGPGSSAFDLTKAGAIVNAIDISNVAIQQAQKKAEDEGLDITFQVMNAEDLKFEDNSFDVICGSGIIHHLELHKAFSEIRRTLTLTGRAIFFEPLGHNPLINFYRNLTPKMRTEDEHPLLFSDLDIAREYFAEVNVTHFNLFATAAAFLPFLKSSLNSIDKWIFKKIPGLKKYSWIIVLELSKPK